MATYTIGDVSQRTGVPASTLRYYEGIGLVPPVTRSPSGYRLYDDATVERLAFISRAKQLGCSLVEITDLIETWDAETCGPVQRRLHALVTDKMAESAAQIAQLTAFTFQLRQAAAQLSGPPVDGPCADDCACLSAAPPFACTLEAPQLPGRLADWASVLAHVVSRTTAPDGALRLVFDGPDILTALVSLVVAEQACCSFFSFAVTVDVRGAALEISAPADAADTVAALFGPPAPATPSS